MLAYGFAIGKYVFELPSEVVGAVGISIGVFGLVVAAEVEERRITFIPPETHVELELEIVPDLDFAGEVAGELVGPVVVGRKGH